MVSTIAWASTRPSSIGKTNLFARNGRFSQRGVSTSILSQAPKLGPPPIDPEQSRAPTAEIGGRF